MTAVKGFFGAFCAIFRAPPGYPGVERQSSARGALDDEEFFVIEGWGGGADAGSFSQVSGHQSVHN